MVQHKEPRQHLVYRIHICAKLGQAKGPQEHEEKKFKLEGSVPEQELPH